MEHRSVMFFACILYQMAEKWRGIGASQSFEEIFISKRLDIALLKIKEEGLFEEFTNDFYKINNLHKISNLGDILSKIISCLMIRVDGDNYFYHLDCLTESSIKTIMESNDLPLNIIKKTGQRLNELLDEQEL